MKQFNYLKGQVGEEAAEEFLRKKGYQILERNFQTKFGEIDIIARQHLQGERSSHLGGVILATGCFDVLHTMHRRLLAAAKKLGGILLVGVETDQRIRRLKGQGRPVNPLNVRLKNLQQLGIADKVFALPKQFNDLNHFTALINQIRPDILAVSASTPHLAVKRRIMKRSGGRVVIVLPHNPKISTTKVLKSKHE